MVFDMKHVKTALVLLMLMTFGANAYASAFAVSCNCAGMAQPEAVGVDMQCHDTDETGEALGEKVFHDEGQTCAHNYCGVSSQASLFSENSAADPVSQGAPPRYRVETRRFSLSYSINHPPKRVS